VHGEDDDVPANAALKQVPFFLRAVSKPPYEGSSPKGTSPIPSRETTTWQAPMEEEEVAAAEEAAAARAALEARVLETPRPLDFETMPTPAAEAKGRSRSADAGVPAEDWRSLLQVHGTKWRPSGDDGVGIGMYLESPAPGPERSLTDPDDVVPVSPTRAI